MSSTEEVKPVPPKGYRMATDEEREYLPAGSMCYEEGGKYWFHSSLIVRKCLKNAFYAVPDTMQKEPDDTDPKKACGEQKPQLQLIPPALNRETAKALACGAAKYGPWNWRGRKVEMMTYLGALRRHIDCLLDGEDIDPDSGAHHLGHIAAGCGIVLDAAACGTLIDNRPTVAERRES